MSGMSVKCPNCAKSLCTFEDGKLFGHCTRCGATIERTLDNKASVYKREEETDDSIVLARERMMICSEHTLPGQTLDVESFLNEVEVIMDELMTFNEILKDIYSTFDNMDEGRRYRTCELCYEMIDRIYKQFGKFVTEYVDFGMDKELKGTLEMYKKAHGEFATALSKKQSTMLEEYWASRQEEYEDLKKKLEDAKLRKQRIPMYNLQANWEADNEIAELEERLYTING